MILEVAEISLAAFTINLFSQKNEEVMETAGKDRKMINHALVDLVIAALITMVFNVHTIELSGTGPIDR